jgi:hypothetical protein
VFHCDWPDRFFRALFSYRRSPAAGTLTIAGCNPGNGVLSLTRTGTFSKPVNWGAELPAVPLFFGPAILPLGAAKGAEGTGQRR